MNLRELISALECLAEEHGDEVEVRLAQQPRWPFELSVGEVLAVDLNAGDEEYDEPPPPDYAPPGPEVVVYLAEGGHLGYLPGRAQSALGWGR